jgi:ligand-binding sensor domain-containing protein/signal transduction histidine kinase/DNA-binding response OmpR family regulator
MQKIFFCFLLVLSQVSFAGKLDGTYSPDPNYLTYTTENGLSNNIVTAITQDNNGYMWFGTEDGLNRFDGQNFKIYRYHPDNKNSLAGPRVTSLHVDIHNQLWIGTESGGFSLYRAETDSFINFHHDSLNKNSLSSNAINALESDDEFLWVATDTGVSKLDITTHKIQRIGFNSTNGIGTNHQKISSLSKDSKNNIWIGTLGGGLNRYNPETKLFTYFKSHHEKTNSLLTDQITNVFVDSYDDVWIAAELKGLNKYELKCQCFKTYNSIASDPTTLSNNMVMAFTENNQKQLWLGTNYGAVTYNRNKDNFQRYRLLKEHELGTGIRYIRSAYTSNDGTVWLGNFQTGLVSIPSDGFKFQTYRYAKNNTSLKSSDINSLYIENNQLWTGSVEGLFRYTLAENGQLTFKDEVSHSFVLKILKSTDQSYWLASNNGLIHLDSSLKEISRFTKKDFTSQYIREDAVLDVIESKRGDIFMASWEGGFSKLINESDATFELIGLKNDPRGQLQSLSIYSLLEDKQENIWIGSRGGIDKFDQTNNKIINYSLVNNNHVKATVYYIFEGSSGIWLATNFGLYHYQESEDKFKLFPLKLDSHYIQAIAEESKSILWLTTFNGLYRVNLNSQSAIKFNKEDGTQGNEFNTKGILNSNNGWLYFAGIDGVTRVNTNKKEQAAFQSTIDFTDIHFLQSNIIESIAKKNQLDIQANQNSFTLSFSVNDYRRPKKLKYRYRINNHNWNELINTREIQFVNQNVGLFSIEVQTSDHLGNWQTHTRKLSININPPLWQTNKAYFLYVSLILLLLFTGYKIRINRVKQHQKELETKVIERTAEVNNLLVQKENLFANISHELRTPLTLISAPLEQLIDDSNLTPKQNKLLKMANNNSKRLFHLVEKILNLTSIEQHKRSIENIVIDDLLIKYIIAFEPLLQAKNIHLSKALTSHAVLNTDKDDLASVIENLLTNALKYTLNNGWVKLNSSISNDQYQLVVENSHQGLTEIETQKVFERFERLGQSDSEQGFGLGLAFVKELCQQNNWNIECKSSQNVNDKNSSVSFILTIKNYSVLAEDATPSQRQINQLTPNKKEKNSRKGKQSILIVEDNTELREFLSDIFSSEYSVTTAENGLLGVTNAINEIPDIVISDVMMPELDGYQLVEQLSQHDNTCHIPIILLTAKADKESELKGLELGSIDYITKPFDAKELQLKVKNTLTRKLALLSEIRNTTKNTDKHNVQYTTERDKNFIEKLNQIVEQNYIESDFSVEQLVDKIAMSERQLQRKLKALFNQTPAEFIRYYRLQKSKELLLAGKSISNVADLVGFNSSSYFSRSFKATFEQSPSEFIQEK